MISGIGSSAGFSSAQMVSGSTMSRGRRVAQDPDQMAEELFAKTDADGNGSITKSELESALKSRSRNGDGPNADDLFTQLDADGDGTITKQEHTDGLKALQQKFETMGRMMAPPDPSQMAEDLFASADTDENGSISKDDLEAVLKARKDDGRGPSADDIFTSSDANGDGTITEQELSDGLKALEEKRRSESGGQQGSDSSALGGSASMLASFMASAAKSYQVMSGNSFGLDMMSSLSLSA